LNISDSFDNTYTNFTLEIYNNPPALNEKINDVKIQLGTNFSFTLSKNIFIDKDGDELSFKAYLNENDLLPSWIDFNNKTLTFNGSTNS